MLLLVLGRTEDLDSKFTELLKFTIFHYKPYPCLSKDWAVMAHNYLLCLYFSLLGLSRNCSQLSIMTLTPVSLSWLNCHGSQLFLMSCILSLWGSCNGSQLFIMICTPVSLRTELWWLTVIHYDLYPCLSKDWVEMAHSYSLWSVPLSL